MSDVRLMQEHLVDFLAEEALERMTPEEKGKFARDEIEQRIMLRLRQLEAEGKVAEVEPGVWGPARR
jgi:hypothetical protein